MLFQISKPHVHAQPKLVFYLQMSLDILCYLIIYPFQHFISQFGHFIISIVGLPDQIKERRNCLQYLLKCFIHTGDCRSSTPPSKFSYFIFFLPLIEFVSIELSYFFPERNKLCYYIALEVNSIDVVLCIQRSLKQPKYMKLISFQVSVTEFPWVTILHHSIHKLNQDDFRFQLKPFQAAVRDFFNRLP